MGKRPAIDVVVVAREKSEALATCLAALREHAGYRRLHVVVDASEAERIRETGASSAVAIVPEDAVVTPGWLEKLAACMQSAPDIASVTPLTTQSIPMAAHCDADTVAAAVTLAAVPIYPEIPAAGPVALVRCDAGGARHVLCDDAYVATAGAAEAAPGLAPIAAMVSTQLRLARIAEFPGVLHVVHPRGGGTEKYIRELIENTREDYRHYFLRIHEDRWQLMDIGDRGSYVILRNDPAQADWLRSMCAWLRIGVIHVHSLVGSGDDLARMIAEASLPYCYSVHDMYLPCPTVYLIDANGEYCNATTDPAVCRRCLAQFASLPIDIESWRARYARFLAGAARVYAPSRWAADTLLRYYPHAAVTVAPPHEQAVRASAPRDATSVFRMPDDGSQAIGILGAIGPEKGARIVEALAARIRERSMPLRLVVIGYTDTLSRCQSDDRVLTVHGAYAREEIEALLDAYRIRLLLFPTVWPETYSYTLSEGWMAGRPALVPPRGALAERVAATGAGFVIDEWPDLDALLDQLVRVTSEEQRGELTRKATLARAVFHDEARALMRAPDLYGDLLDEPRPPAAASRYAIYESACRALGVAPMKVPMHEQPAQPPTVVHRVMQLLRR